MLPNDRPFIFTGNVTVEGKTVTITGLAHVVEDAAPVLGGQLECNGNPIHDDTLILAGDSAISFQTSSEMAQVNDDGMDVAREIRARSLRLDGDQGGVAGVTTLTQTILAPSALVVVFARGPAGYQNSAPRWWKFFDGTNEYSLFAISKA